MNQIKERLRKLEKPVVITYLVLWLLIYVLSRIFLEMYTDHSPKSFWLWAAIVIAPFSIYAGLRTTFSKGEKWYSFIGYFLIYTIGGIMISEYMMVNGDILLNVAVKPVSNKEVAVLDVEKVFKRKLGFDHTAVTLRVGARLLVLEARPYSYFYLWDKKTLRVSLGKSSLGNDYVTSIDVGEAEKLQARWLYLKDWMYRFRLLWIFLICTIIALGIGMKYFPDKPESKPLKLGFWKLMGIVMGIVFALGILLYAGLWLYITFFSTR